MTRASSVYIVALTSEAVLALTAGEVIFARIVNPPGKTCTITQSRTLIDMVGFSGGGGGPLVVFAPTPGDHPPLSLGIRRADAPGAQEWSSEYSHSALLWVAGLLCWAVTDVLAPDTAQYLDIVPWVHPLNPLKEETDGTG